jgi:hypothetical protein
MNKLLIFTIIGLVGCTTTVPVTVKFPDVPDTLMTPPPTLKPLADNKRDLSDLLENVNKNYGTYYMEREKLIAWQDWYVKQKQINDDLHK